MASLRKVLCLLVTLLAGLSGKTRSRLQGPSRTVADPSGAVGAGSVGQRQTTETGLTRTATTAHDGIYVSAGAAGWSLPAAS